MKKDSRENHARYVELNLFPEEKEDHQKDSVSSENKENHISPDKEYDLTDLFERLSKSAFRSRFHLSKRDKEYIAQHATGCCCRGCFFKWHHIPAGRQLTREEQQYAVAVLMAWIEKQKETTQNIMK